MYGINEYILFKNSNLITYTEINGNTPGCIAMGNGIYIEFGTYPMNALISDSNSGGYKVVISLKRIKTYNIGYVTPIYALGFPRCAISYRESGKITLSCDVSVNSGYISWMVIGKG